MPVVAAIQQACFQDKTNNLQHTSQLIGQAVAKGAELVVLQELHASQYFCQSEDADHFDLAESIPGLTTDTLANLAAKHKVVIVGSVFEKRASGLYHNTAVVLEKDGSLAGCYRKMHIPDDPGYYEKYYFTPGDASDSLGFRPINCSLGKLGVLVCWDQWYPEAARLMALAGADVLIYPTAIGWDPLDSREEQQRQLDAWLTVQRAHAIANGLPVVVANRTGHEAGPSASASGINFWGSSFICGPQGEILCRGDNGSENVITAALDWQQTDQVRRIWPFLRDRRIDAYHDLIQRYID